MVTGQVYISYPPAIQAHNRKKNVLFAIKTYDNNRDMESKFLFLFCLASKVKNVFFCRSGLFSLKNTTVLLYVFSHVFQKQHSFVTEKNAKIVVFSPSSFHRFLQEKERKNGRKKIKNEKIALDKQKTCWKGKNQIHYNRKCDKKWKNVGWSAERLSETEIPHRHAAPRSAAGRG